MKQNSNWLRIVVGLFIVVYFWALESQGTQPRFFLSTERVFSPQENDIKIRLEARSVPYVDFRLYRVPDPQKFFAQQEDLHRVILKNAPKGPSSLDVLSEAWRASNENLFNMMRNRFSKKARKVGGKAYAETLSNIYESGTTQSTPRVVVPFLQGYELVDLWREDVSYDSQEWSYLDVAITPRQAGVYLVEGIYGKEIGYTVVILSKIVLLTRQSQDRFLVYAVDAELGNPLPDVLVTALKGAKVVGKGTTDKNGIWEIDIPLIRKMVVYASSKQDFALADPTYHPANLFRRKVYLTTERPVYRPGQEVNFKGIIRGYKDEKYIVEKEIKETEVFVIDSNGQEVHRQKLSVFQSGTFDGKFDLFEEASMGTYRLLAKVGDERYGSEFKVKAYRKPEYKVSVSTSKSAYVSGQKVTASIKANYYFGPPVPNAKFKVNVSRTRFYIPWWIDADYSWYYSDFEYQSSIKETVLEKEGRLDQKGEFHIDFNTLPESRDYTYVIEAIVTDAANNAISGRGRIKVTEAQFRIAIDPEYLIFSPGQEARLNLTTSDYDKNPIAADVQVEITAQTGDQPSDKVIHQILDTRVSTGKEGKRIVTFTPERGGVYTVIAKARDKSGHQLETETLIYVTASGGDIPYVPGELEIIADRRSYQMGDKARFLFLAPHPNAHLLVTIEGGGLYQHQVIRARGHSALFETLIGEAQTPNFLVRIATVFDHALLKRRLDVVVPPREKLLNVSIKASKAKSRPGDKVSLEVTVTDYQKQPIKNAEVALAVVDEAVYGINPEIAVPISKFFYSRKRNNVRSSCSLNFRFYGYGQESKDKMAAIDIRQPVVPGSFKAVASGKIRKRFKDTLDFFARLVTDSNGVARTTVTMPDNLTTWRFTARAVTDDTKVGQATGRATVTKPVVVRLAAPAYLVEKDVGTFAVLVHNYTQKLQEFEVSLAAKLKKLDLTGQSTKVKVAPGQVGVVSWQARAVSPGEELLVVSAKAPEVPGLEDSFERKVDIRPYGVLQVLTAGGTLDDVQAKQDVVLTVPEGAVEESVKASVTLSNGIAPALLASLDYLTGYPYGCTEQTMNKFLPDLVVAKALKDLGMKSTKLEKKLPQYIHAGLSHLARLQHGDGGWGWWQEDATDAFMTAYVVHGLVLAKRLGWNVDADMLNRGSNRLKSLVTRSNLNPNQRAYLLYSLSLAGVKYESMLDKLEKRKGGLTDYGKALLAMALFEMGQKESAVRLAGQLDMVVQSSPKGSLWGKEGGLGWENDPIESTALVLRSLLSMKPESGNISAAVKWLMAMRQGNHWQSTRDTAMVVYALVDYLKKSGGREYDAKITVALNDNKVQSREFTKEDVFKSSVTLLDDQPGHVGANTFKLAREGKGTLFYDAVVTYFGREEQIKARGKRFVIDRRMLAIRKQIVADGWEIVTQPLDGSVKPGDEILVVLELQANQEADYLMIEDPIPAGVVPIEHDRGYAIKGYRLQQARMHREFHDQHAAFFISNLRKGKRTLAYLVRATLPGQYNIMPARILPMYYPQFAGNSANDRIIVEE
jgi:uncharacterized protein YfaS (alpha-2-macroglobulin family)